VVIAPRSEDGSSVHISIVVLNRTSVRAMDRCTVARADCPSVDWMSERRNVVASVASFVTIAVGLGGVLLTAALTANPIDRQQLTYGVLCFVFALLVPLLVFEVVPGLRSWDERSQAIGPAPVRRAASRRNRSAPGKVTVEEAAYGIGPPQNWRNVTEEVRAMLRDDKLAITATHLLFADTRDPAKGQEKRLDIEWCLDGVRQPKAFFVENTPAMLPPGNRSDWEALNYYLNGSKYVGPK